MKIAAFIPARYGSTRFPGKPLALIAGKPMIQHVYEHAAACRELSDVYVATDDERILECVEGFGGKAVMTSDTHRSGTDRISEAAKSMGLNADDIVVNIQGDQPTFPSDILSQLVGPLIADPSIPMSTLMYRIRDEENIRNPNHVKVVTDKDGFALYFSRFPIPFCRDEGSEGRYFKHLGFYGFRMSFLVEFTGIPEGLLESIEKLEQLRALENGFRIKVVESFFDSIEVDVPKDIDLVEEGLHLSNPY